MRKHERDVHDGNGPNIYCCHCCDKRYQSGASLSKHLIKKHGFQLPSGHRRFTYRQDLDGVYRVQTTRMESLEVSEQIMKPSVMDIANDGDVQISLTNYRKNERGGLSICLVATQTNVNEKEETVIETKPKPDLSMIDMEEEVLPEFPETNTSMTEMETDAPVELDEIKNIDNFSVMKKYLKKKRQKRKIIITVDEVDELGNIVNTETVNANEFHMKKLLHVTPSWES